jgi:hypothetical protein
VAAIGEDARVFPRISGADMDLSPVETDFGLDMYDGLPAALEL